MMLSRILSGPCDTPVMPLQLIAVGVIDGVKVGLGVLKGVKVNVGGRGLPLTGAN